MQSLESIADLLKLKSSLTLSNYTSINAELKSQKIAAVEDDDQALATRIWCLEHVAEIQVGYQSVYDTLQNREYFAGWCGLERVELALMRLQPHFTDSWQEYWLGFIQSKTEMLQSLFPYRLFMSPEILELEKRCSICDSRISIRNPCGHRVGQIYNGEYCYRNVTKSEFLSCSMVKDPVQKYSVPFPIDPTTGESKDHYNYSTVEYLIKRWPSAFHDWRADWITALHPKKFFGQLRRNDKCPCDSGKKYKACCLTREGILRPHCEFTFNYPLAADLQTVELSY